MIGYKNLLQMGGRIRDSALVCQERGDASHCDKSSEAEDTGVNITYLDRTTGKVRSVAGSMDVTISLTTAG